MKDIDRRKFLLGMAAAGGTLAPSLQGLVAYGQRAPAGGARPVAAAGAGAYGPLRPAGPELALPEGFRYVTLGVEGSTMSDGNPTPRAHDGMAAFPLPNGNIRLVRNHEDRSPPPTATLHGPAETAYDVRAGGGTTSLEIRILPDGTRELVRDFVSLNGTLYNCAGGPTPWGTWLTCEETTEGTARGWGQPHGYVFEVDATAEGTTVATPIKGMGRFAHEAVALDPETGIVYLTEDARTAGFYRYIPDQPGRLAAGGRLQMLAVARNPHFITANDQTVGRTRQVTWIDIEDADPETAEANPSAVFADGFGRGAALFSRLEGCWYGDGSVYFNATDGGDARLGQIWQYRPTEPDGGELTLLFESPSVDVLNSPDNITVSPRGGLVICEDASGAYIRGLTPQGEIFDLARNIFNDREFAGACFSPDGSTLFVNVQGDTAPRGPGDLGYTFAIWGPWEAGAL